MDSKTESAGRPAEAAALPAVAGINVDESLLTVADVAMLASGSGQLPAATVRRVAAANRTDPRFAGHYQALATLARGAGFHPVRDEDLETALDCHRDFHRLLETEGWEHPSEILDPAGELGVSYRELANIAAAFAERTGGAGRAPAVREKLERAWADEREKVAPVVTFVARLLDHDDETAEELLRQASLEYKRQRRRART